jgi:hypothetical protein
VSAVVERRRAAWAARRAARSQYVGWLGRAGLCAQGTCFVIIGVLALTLAAGVGGAATDPQGALVTLARHGWTRVLIVVLAIGFAAYALWRLSQALLDRGGMGTDAGGLARARHPARAGARLRRIDGECDQDARVSTSASEERRQACGRRCARLARWA